MKAYAILGALIATCATGHADSLDRSTNRLIRDSANSFRAPRVTTLAVPPGAVEPPVMSLTIGLAHEHDEDGTNIATTPFLFDYAPNKDSRWDFQFYGDGYTRETSPATETARGLGDLNLLASYKRKFNTRFALKAAAEVTAPAHGDVGSKHWSQDVRLIGSYLASDPSADNALVPFAGMVIAHAGDTPAGVSPYGRVFLAGAEYDWGDPDNGFALIGKVKHKAEGGTRSSNAGNIEFDFPLYGKNWGGSLVGERGFTAGSRSSSIEFDVTYKF